MKQKNQIKLISTTRVMTAHLKQKNIMEKLGLSKVSFLGESYKNNRLIKSKINIRFSNIKR